MSGLLIVLSAPSGTGKGAVRKEIFRRRDDIDYSVSWITRAPRPEDVEGVTYFFKTEQEFESLSKSGGFLEEAGLYGKRYGTPKGYVEERTAIGRLVMLEIDTQGALQVLEKVRNGAVSCDVVSVFLVPPDMSELHRRLVGRGMDPPEKIKERFEFAYRELDFAGYFDYVIINDEISACADKIEAIIAAKLCESPRGALHISKLKEEKL